MPSSTRRGLASAAYSIAHTTRDRPRAAYTRHCLLGAVSSPLFTLSDVIDEAYSVPRRQLGVLDESHGLARPCMCTVVVWCRTASRVWRVCIVYDRLRRSTFSRARSSSCRCKVSILATLVLAQTVLTRLFGARNFTLPRQCGAPIARARIGCRDGSILTKCVLVYATTTKLFGVLAMLVRGEMLLCTLHGLVSAANIVAFRALPAWLIVPGIILNAARTAHSQ